MIKWIFFHDLCSGAAGKGITKKNHFNMKTFHDIWWFLVTFDDYWWFLVIRSGELSWLIIVIISRLIMTNHHPVGRGTSNQVRCPNIGCHGRSDEWVMKMKFHLGMVYRLFLVDIRYSCFSRYLIYWFHLPNRYPIFSLDMSRQVELKRANILVTRYAIPSFTHSSDRRWMGMNNLNNILALSIHPLSDEWVQFYSHASSWPIHLTCPVQCTCNKFSGFMRAMLTICYTFSRIHPTHTQNWDSPVLTWLYGINIIKPMSLLKTVNLWSTLYTVILTFSVHLLFGLGIF